MDATLSVSKGVFVFKNGFTRASKTARKSDNTKSISNGIIGSEATQQPFYATYTATWRSLQNDIEQFQRESNANMLHQLVDYVSQESSSNRNEYDFDEMLPTAALLTGINQPDHLKQFAMFSESVRKKIAARVCMLQARDCATLKATIETMVYNLIETEHDNCDNIISDNDEEDEENDERQHKRLRRSQCNMKQLLHWYRNNFYQESPADAVEEEQSDEEQDVDLHSNNNSSPALVIILPDFECFPVPVLQDFILLLSAQCSRLPFVLVLGVATCVQAVHNTLAYHVTSKIKLRIFQTLPATVEFNEIVENVILSPKTVFHLSGKAFKLLTHIFLYYDFSINGFIQGFKYCVMEHYFQGNCYALCQSYSSSLQRIKTLKHADMESIRRLLSFRPYVESLNDCKRIIDILTDDEYLKQTLPTLLRNCHTYLLLFRTFLEFLTVLVEDLPKTPLGKQRRELYTLCLSRELVEHTEFKECWQMLSFMSKDEFVTKISKAINITMQFVEQELKPLELGDDCALIVEENMAVVKELLQKVRSAGLQSPKNTQMPTTTSKEKVTAVSSRQELKERLLQMSKQERAQNISEFNKSVGDILNYIKEELLACFLRPLARAPPLHELFIFNDIDIVKRHIIGSPRAALHMALTNPHYYLQCQCCELREQSQLLPTMPDICIVYKLHLECGRLINLYDWLQAFRTVVESQSEENEVDQINPEIQARFTRAVAEMQFLGFIKMSKRKRDHAQRLTW